MRAATLMLLLLAPLDALAVCNIVDACFCTHNPDWIAVVRGASSDGGHAPAVVEGLYQRVGVDAGPNSVDLAGFERMADGTRVLLAPARVSNARGERFMSIGADGGVRCENETFNAEVWAQALVAGTCSQMLVDANIIVNAPCNDVVRCGCGAAHPASLLWLAALVGFVASRRRRSESP